MARSSSGLNGLVVKSHGSATDKGVANAIRVAARMVREDLTRKIAEDLANVSAQSGADGGGEMSRRSVIVGTGSALPPRRVTNAELAERVDTTHEWIVERTGIEARHIAADGETTATLATEAARKALAAAGIAGGRDRPDRARHRHAGPDLPGQRDPGPDRARHRRLHRLRRAGGLHRLPLRARRSPTI